MKLLVMTIMFNNQSTLKKFNTNHTVTANLTKKPPFSLPRDLEGLRKGMLCSGLTISPQLLAF